MSPFDEGKKAVAVANKAAANAQAKTGKIDVEGHEVASEDTPQVNGYSFVATPSPMPGVEESPFMTWGTCLLTLAFSVSSAHSWSAQIGWRQDLPRIVRRILNVE